MRDLDTCLCLEFLRGRLPEGYKQLHAGRSTEFALPAVVVAELYYGAEHSANPEKQLRLVDAFVAAFKVVDFDTACAKEYGRLRQELAQQGSPIGDRDTMIAAMCLANRAMLVTDNVKDFERIPGFAYEVWAEVDF